MTADKYSHPNLFLTVLGDGTGTFALLQKNTTASTMIFITKIPVPYVGTLVLQRGYNLSDDSINKCQL